METTLNYCADFEETASVSNGSQPIQKFFCERMQNSTSTTEEDDQSMPLSDSSAPKTDPEIIITEPEFSALKSLNTAHSKSTLPPPPTTSSASTRGCESSAKLAVQPFVPPTIDNLLVTDTLGETSALEKVNFIQHSPLVGSAFHEGSSASASRLACPTVRLTNKNTNTLIEINLPEKSDNFKGSITVDSDIHKNEIKLSYDAVLSKMVEPQLCLTNKEETQARVLSPPVPPLLPQTASLTDELKESFCLITSRMEELFQIKVNELVESCTKHMAILKAQQNEVTERVGSPDMSSNARISSPDLSTPESLLKELDSDSPKNPSGSCHEDNDDSPSVLESIKMELEERISKRLKALTNPVRDKTQQIPPMDYKELFRLTQETIDALLQKELKVQPDASKVPQEGDVSADQVAYGRSMDQIILPSGISCMERLLPDPSGSPYEIEENRVSFGPELFKDQLSILENSLSPSMPTTESDATSPQNARLRLTEPSCNLKPPEDIEGLKFYDSDVVSEGEVGYAYTSNSYSSGEIKPRDVGSKDKMTVFLIVEGERSDNQEQKDLSASRGRLSWDQSKEEAYSFCNVFGEYKQQAVR